jgi:hypothetical protein
MARFHYETCCVNSTAGAINAMTERARAVTFRTFARNCDWRDWARDMGYGRWLPLEKDWAVCFFRSVYEGRRCYYVDHSRIEHIFTESLT